MEKTKRFKVDSAVKSYIEKTVMDCLSIEKVDYQLVDISPWGFDTRLTYNKEHLGILKIEFDYDDFDLMLTFNKYTD